MIADGSFKEAYSRAVRAFFQKEPYASFRYYFDVYVVTAVSRNEMIDEDIAYSTHHQGEFYEQDSEKVRAYALKVPELGGETANVTVMVVLNERSGGRVHSDWYNASDYYVRVNCTYESPMFLLSRLPWAGRIVERERIYFSTLAVRNYFPYIECGYGLTNRIFSIGTFFGFSSHGYEGFGVRFGFELFSDW